MRSDIVSGGIFPRLRTARSHGQVRKLSELQGEDPLTLTLARGHYCPKEHQQHLELAAFYPKIAVAYTQIATIATDDHPILRLDNTLTRTPPFIVHMHDLVGLTVTSIISSIRDRIFLQLTPAPSTMTGGPAAGAEQCVFFQRSGNKGHQKGAVSVGTEANQISSAALRTFHAVANTEAHRACLQSYIRPVKELFRKCSRRVRAGALGVAPGCWRDSPEDRARPTPRPSASNFHPAVL